MFSQLSVRPLRYGASARFDTMPSTQAYRPPHRTPCRRPERAGWTGGTLVITDQLLRPTRQSAWHHRYHEVGTPRAR